MLPVLKPEQVIEILEQRGSHRKYRKCGRVVVVPMHYELLKGTLLSILDQAGLTLDDLNLR